MTHPTITRTPAGNLILTFPYDADLVESLKDEIPARARSYNPSAKRWTVFSAYAQVAARLMFETFPDVDLVEHASTGPLFDRVALAGDAYRVLHLLPSAPPELVTAAHRCLAKLNHHDAGGNTITMQQINAAVDVIREAS